MNNTLVAFFSPTGTTKASAEKLADILNADLYEICPQVPYTAADLDWRDENSRSSVEMKNPDSRPAIADHNADVEAYDSILIGFPIWWYTAPTIINTFIESYDFTGKNIVIFATSGGTSIMKAVMDLSDALKGKGSIRGSMLTSNPICTDEMLEDWARGLQLP